MSEIAPTIDLKNSNSSNHRLIPEQKNTLQQTNIPEFFKQYAYASIASLAPKMALAPIDRMKLLAQSQNELIRMGKLNKEWKGYMDLVKRTNKHEGLTSFWKGNGAYLFRYSISSGLGLTVKDQLHRLDKSYYSRTATNNKNQKAIKNFMYGGLGGLTGMAVAYPLEYARTRLGNDLGSKKKNNREFTGIYDSLKKAHRAEGIRGIYKGFSMTVPTIFLYRGIQYGGYDTVTKYMQQNRQLGDSELIAYFYKFWIGWGIGISANFIVHPLNTESSKYMEIR